jgi:hypothetical protein
MYLKDFDRIPTERVFDRVTVQIGTAEINLPAVETLYD